MPASLFADALRRVVRPTLPTLEGKIKVAGLTGAVEVLRDRFGVPQVFAEDENDLFFAQGYVQAQDRFFQMELGRRAGHGRLSELLGENALDLDRLSRTMSFGKVAASSVQLATAETLQILESYAAGVNAYLATQPRPPEFLLLRHRPEPWRPVDTATWATTVAWSLSASWESKLLTGYVDEETRDGRRAGSNAWAVAPDRSASGSALLAGDPHLSLGIPSLWYEVGLYGGPYEVVGASLPGMPGVVIGHNQSIAWSVTAALTDVQDLYVERFSRQDPKLYEYKGEWREAEVREERIFIRGRSKPVMQRVRTTVHGPIVSDVFGGDEDLALHWATPCPLELVRSGLAINRAQDKEQFLDALRGWTAPNQNFVYADRTGVIGRVLAGPVPLRNNHRGDRPVPGWTGEFEWEGFMPFEDLPRTFDPPECYVVSANEAPEAASIPGEYLPAYRRERIEWLLQSTDKHALGTFREIQGDLYCAPAHALAGKLAMLKPLPEVSAELMRELETWDGRLVAESRPGAIARVTLEILLYNTTTVMPRLDSPLPSGAESYYVRLVPELVDKLDDLSEDTLQAALRAAVEMLAAEVGPTPARWRWGTLHLAKLRHPLGVLPALQELVNRGPYPTDGDANTVCLAAFDSNGPGQSPSFSPVTTGPTYRFIVDTGDWDRAWSMISPGQSGHPASENYDDQIDLWRNLHYRPMVFGRRTAELATRHRLVLEPGAYSILSSGR